MARRSVRYPKNRAYWKRRFDRIVSIMARSGLPNMQPYYEFFGSRGNNPDDRMHSNGTWWDMKPENTKNNILIVQMYDPSVPPNCDPAVEFEHKWVTHMWFDPWTLSHYLALIRSGRRDYLKWTDIPTVYLNDLKYTSERMAVEFANHYWACDCCTLSQRQCLVQAANIEENSPVFPYCDFCKISPEDGGLCELCYLSLEIHARPFRVQCTQCPNAPDPFDLCMPCYTNNPNIVCANCNTGKYLKTTKRYI